MFCLPILVGSVSRVAPQVFVDRLWIDLVMSLMLFASVFVLGGNFWDKIRALFHHDARVVFPGARRDRER